LVRGFSWQAKYSGCSKSASLSFTAGRSGCMETPKTEKPFGGLWTWSQQRPSPWSLLPLRSRANCPMSHIKELAQNMQESPDHMPSLEVLRSNQPSSMGSSKLVSGMALTFCMYSTTGSDQFVPLRGSNQKSHIKKLALRDKSCSCCCV